MSEGINESGLAYANKILQNRWQSLIIYWLGFRPFTKSELTKLLPEMGPKQLAEKLHALQNLRVVNPVRDTENRYSLTDDGDQLRSLMLSTGVWGVQQQDTNEDREPVLVVEPEMDAQLTELIRYRDTVDKYFG